MLQGPYDSSLIDGEQYGAPLNSNTRLLWYRKSVLGDRPVPQTWDELLDTAEQLGIKLQETGKRAESLVVFFNALVESAGGSIVQTGEDGKAEISLERGTDGEGAGDPEAVRVLQRRPDGPVDQRRGRQPAGVPEHRQRQRLHGQLAVRLPERPGGRPAAGRGLRRAPATRRSTRARRPGPRSAATTSASAPSPTTGTRRSPRSTASPSRRSSARSPPPAVSRRCSARWPTTRRSRTPCRSCR